MKYLKLFEEKWFSHIPKFKIKDAVKIKNDPSRTIYAISGYEYRKDSMIKDICRLTRYKDKDKLADKEGFYCWVQEDLLKSIPDYELDAIKYNII